MGNIRIVFDGGPGPVAGRFVEVERDGKSISWGEWTRYGEDHPEWWALEVPDDAATVAGLGRELVARLEDLEASKARVAQLEGDLTQAHEMVGNLSAGNSALANLVSPHDGETYAAAAARLIAASWDRLARPTGAADDGSPHPSPDDGHTLPVAIANVLAYWRGGWFERVEGWSVMRSKAASYDKIVDDLVELTKRVTVLKGETVVATAVRMIDMLTADHEANIAAWNVLADEMERDGAKFTPSGRQMSLGGAFKIAIQDAREAAKRAVRESLDNTNTELMNRLAARDQAIDRMTGQLDQITAERDRVVSSGDFHRKQANDFAWQLRNQAPMIHAWREIAAEVGRRGAASVDQIASVVRAVKNRDGAARNLDGLRKDYERACETIAKMHAAAIGVEGHGPIRGVVEDIEDLRKEHLDNARELGEIMHALGTSRHLSMMLSRIEALKTANSSVSAIRAERDALLQKIAKATAVLVPHVVIGTADGAVGSVNLSNERRAPSIDSPPHWVLHGKRIDDPLKPQ